MATNIHYLSTGRSIVGGNADVTRNFLTFSANVKSPISVLGVAITTHRFNNQKCKPPLISCFVNFPNQHLRCFLPTFHIPHTTKGGKLKKTKGAVLPAITNCRQGIMPDFATPGGHFIGGTGNNTF